jgi:hypothetical protein
MSSKPLTFATTLILPAALLTLAGCATPPANPLATQSSPTLAGGLPVLKTVTEKAVVVSVVPAERTLALRSKAGTTTTAKAAPQVSNYGQFQAGERVKATVTKAAAIFLVKNGPPPSAGAGVVVAGPAEAGQAAAVTLATTDSPGKAIKVDPSYRLMTVEYADATTKEFKVPLPNTLENVQKGDAVVVRTTEPLAIQVEPK